MGSWRLHLHCKRPKISTRLLVRPGFSTAAGTLDTTRASLGVGQDAVLVMEDENGVVVGIELIQHALEAFERGDSEAFDSITGVDELTRTITLNVQVKKTYLGMQAGLAFDRRAPSHRTRRSKYANDKMRANLRTNLTRFAPGSGSARVPRSPHRSL